MDFLQRVRTNYFKICVESGFVLIGNAAMNVFSPVFVGTRYKVRYKAIAQRTCTFLLLMETDGGLSREDYTDAHPTNSASHS